MSDTVAKLRARIEKLEAALRAAMKFIDANVADPDITDEMATAWIELMALKPSALLKEDRT